MHSCITGENKKNMASRKISFNKANAGKDRRKAP